MLVPLRFLPLSRLFSFAFLKLPLALFFPVKKSIAKPCSNTPIQDLPVALIPRIPAHDIGRDPGRCNVLCLQPEGRSS